MAWEMDEAELWHFLDQHGGLKYLIDQCEPEITFHPRLRELMIQIKPLWIEMKNIISSFEEEAMKPEKRELYG